MIQETKHFKKRFHCCSISKKIRITRLLGEHIESKKMPGGREMDEDEYIVLDSLLEWCNQNTFFDVLPKNESHVNL